MSAPKPVRTTATATYLDEPGVAVSRLYRVEHRTSYTYSDTVSASYGRGYLRPREVPWQQCLDHTLSITPVPSDGADSLDVYGNIDSFFHVTTGHRELAVTGVSTVRVTRSGPAPELAELPWERARLARTGPDALAVDFTLTSPLAEVTGAVREYAAASFPAGRPVLDAARDLTHRIFQDFRYDPRATTIGTSTTELLDKRAGVCQDFAHLAVAGLRSLGLAARYVSGYLATQPPPGRGRMVGADASHAWAAVRLADGSWLAMDPTNDQLADERHITLAWGRDYRDVPPLRGVIFTEARESRMSVSVDVAPVDG